MQSVTAKYLPILCQDECSYAQLTEEDVRGILGSRPPGCGKNYTFRNGQGLCSIVSCLKQFIKEGK